MKKNIRIIAAQINTVVGDIYGNTEKIIKNALVARDQQEADVVVFPEMALTGYPPEDLLLRLGAQYLNSYAGRALQGMN